MLECTARFAFIKFRYTISEERPIRLRGGRVDCTTVRMSETDEKVVMERHDPLLDKVMRRYVDPHDDVVIDICSQP